jgi:hypothetical protein
MELYSPSGRSKTPSIMECLEAMRLVGRGRRRGREDGGALGRAGLVRWARVPLAPGRDPQTGHATLITFETRLKVVLAVITWRARVGLRLGEG